MIQSADFRLIIEFLEASFLIQSRSELVLQACNMALHGFNDEFGVLIHLGAFCKYGRVFPAETRFEQALQADGVLIQLGLQSRQCGVLDLQGRRLLSDLFGAQLAKTEHLGFQSLNFPVQFHHLALAGDFQLLLWGGDFVTGSVGESPAAGDVTDDACGTLGGKFALARRAGQGLLFSDLLFNGAQRLFLLFAVHTDTHGHVAVGNGVGDFCSSIRVLVIILDRHHVGAEGGLSVEVGLEAAEGDLAGRAVPVFLKFQGVHHGIQRLCFGDGVDFGLHPLLGHDHGVKSAAFVEDIHFHIPAFDAHFHTATVFAWHDVGDDHGNGEDQDEAGEDEAEAISDDLPGVQALALQFVS